MKTNTNANSGTSREAFNRVENLVLYSHECRATKGGNYLLSCSLSSKNKEGIYSNSINTKVYVPAEVANAYTGEAEKTVLKATGNIKVCTDTNPKNGNQYTYLMIFADALSEFK